MTQLHTAGVLAAFLPIALAAAAIFLVLIGPVVVVLRRYGWIDQPNFRKAHVGAIPIAGGTGLVLTLLVIGIWARVAPASLGLDPDMLGDLAQVWSGSLIAGALLVFIVALTDDRTPIRARWRFITQLTASLATVIGGTVLASMGELLWDAELVLPLWIGVPFTIIGMCGVINAVNMSDGADGLAGGLALVALAWFAVALTFIGSAQSDAAALLPGIFALGGALVGFLILNLRTPWRTRAAIFMGDGGSMTLGFVLAWLAVRTTSSYEAASMPAVVALWILAVPLMDTISAILRRMLSGVTPMSPDHCHLHHLMPALGLTVRRSVALILALSATLGAVGVIGWRLGLPDWVLFWGWITLFFTYHLAALSFWARRPPDPLAPLPPCWQHPVREIRRRLGALLMHGKATTPEVATHDPAQLGPGSIDRGHR